jgi:hypothetical protein
MSHDGGGQAVPGMTAGAGTSDTVAQTPGLDEAAGRGGAHALG